MKNLTRARKSVPANLNTVNGQRAIFLACLAISFLLLIAVTALLARMFLSRDAGSPHPTELALFAAVTAGLFLSLSGVAVIGYNIFSINRRALESAEREAAGLRKAEEELRRKSHDLGERIKELDCLHAISALIERPGITMPEILQGVADLLPPAFQYPEAACAGITLDGSRYQSANYFESGWRLAQPIIIDRQQSGMLEVRYLAERSAACEGPFLKEERLLINTVAERLGRVIERLRARAALVEGEAKYRSVFENASMGIYHSVPDGRFIRVNPALAAMMGYDSPDEMVSSITDIAGQLYVDASQRRRVMDSVMGTDGWIHAEVLFRRKNGSSITANVTMRKILRRDGSIEYLEGFVEDVTELRRTMDALKLNEMRLNSLLELSEKTMGLSENDIIQAALEEAEELTGSAISYLHFVNEDQETIELIAWSKETLKECTADPVKHYPLSKAGVWADCARVKKPVIHNDYANLAGRKGLPEGHSALARHMSVPVIEGGKLRVIAGVGNKRSDYDDADVRQMQLLANDTWRIVQRKRAEDERQKLAAIIETSSDFIGIADLEGKIIYVNEAGLRLSGIESHARVRGMHIREFIAPEEAVAIAPVILPAIMSAGSWVGEFRMINASTGKTVPVEMNAFIIRHPDTREPMAMASITRDISERKRAELALLELATSDPLTGVYNRRRFFELAGRTFKQSLLKGLNLSALMVDADRFKEINDRYGHAVGDRVLTGLVARLRNGLRESDILGRYGGEEFVVLMPGTDRASAMRVAARLLEEVRRSPIDTGRLRLSVTVSVGVSVLEEGRDLAIDDLIRRADEAMYRAKQAGRDCVRVWEDPHAG
ncbi:MAG: diguanylate cyclase [Spirochaetes bacterium]|nr:diguanylate cyclase [Spirochaetota bacterium]